MTITIPQHGTITLAPVDSTDIYGVLLPGSKTYTYKTDFCDILIQHFHAENYVLRFGKFNFIQKGSLSVFDETLPLKSSMALKGNLIFKPDQHPKKKIKEGQFILHNNTNEPVSLHFEKNIEYQLFDASFSIGLLEELFGLFPSLKDFIITDKEKKVFTNPVQASSDMKNIVHNILRCPYDENLRKLYFENKVNDYLFEILVQTFKTEAVQNDLPPLELKAIYKAKEIILSDISQHHSIRKLSRLVHLNIFKLKTGFKKIHGTGVFECLLQARMEKAKKLLNETDMPIKEVASLVGFDFTPNFIISFRKFYGYTPGAIRRKNK
jgi:AraC family transcriptional activator of pyochelin receptor